MIGTLQPFVLSLIDAPKEVPLGEGRVP